VAIDFSWLITALQNITSNITSFFNGIWGATQQIVNVGQGIFSGLAQFGGWIYQGLVDAFNWIYKGLSWIADQIGQAILGFATWLYNGVIWIGQQLYNIGQWLWAGIQGLANMIVNGVLYLASAIYNFFVGVGNMVWSFIVNFKTSLDTWWFNLIAGIRAKIKASMMFTLTTHVAWKGMEKIAEAKSLKEYIFGFGSILISPLPAYIISNVLDSMIPIPSSTPQKVAPDLGALTFTPPDIGLIAPMPPTPTPPTELVAGMGVPIEAKVITVWEKDNAVSPTVPVTSEVSATSESGIDVSPTVEVSGELI